ncbi:MAG: filamentous hemagglutinin N-terminal domain-containing protein, partial [Candidatus Methylumidiphilus sp.]
MNHKLLCWLLAGWPLWAGAEALTDGSVGPVQSLSGQFTVPQALGALRGANLFHSFQTFNINSGESATFTGDNGIQNVISRVTGPGITTINGPLISKVGQADFYFINPNGVTFRSGASIDVPAAFKVSTASELRFPGGVAFSAANPQGSGLSAERPESFGFLGNQSGQITARLANMQAKPGAAVELVGRSVSLDSAVIVAEGGSVRLEGVGAGNHSASVAVPSASAKGAVDIEASIVDVSGDGGGRLALQGRQVAIVGSGLYADNLGDADAGTGISVRADSLSVGNGSEVYARAGADGRAGGIILDIAGTADVDGGSHIASQTFGRGAAGDITGHFGTLSMRNLSIISAATRGQGHAGAVNITTGHIRLSASQIDADSYANATGDAGPVTLNSGRIEATGSFISARTSGDGRGGELRVTAKDIVLDHSKIQSTAQSAEPGATLGGGGNVHVEATHALTMRAGKIVSWSEGAGDAGNIDVRAGSAHLDEASSVDAHSDGPGNAGAISVAVTDGLYLGRGSDIVSNSYLSGNAGDIVVRAGRLEIDGQGMVDGQGEPLVTGIRSAASGRHGAAGNIGVNVKGDIAMRDGSIASSSSGDGAAGGIDIRAANLQMSQHSEILADSAASGGTGEVRLTAAGMALDTGSVISSSARAASRPGSIRIDADTLRLDNGAEIDTTAYGKAGQAGSIDVTAKTRLDIGRQSSIHADNFGASQGGAIHIATGTLHLHDRASLHTIAAAGAAGQAGDISVQADTIRLTGDSYISSENQRGASGDAGNITLAASDALELDNSQISSGTSGAGRGGTVAVSADAISLQNHSQISTAATKGSSGPAGDVSVTAADLLDIGHDAYITSDTYGAGRGGSVQVNAGRLRLHDNGSIQTIALTDSGASAGNIDINVSGDMALSRLGKVDSSAVAASNAGGVRVHAGQLSLDTISGIGTTAVDGDGGDIHIRTDAGLSAKDSFILAFAKGHGAGRGGSILLNVGGDLAINGGGISAETVGSGDAGRIDISAANMALDNGALISTGILGSGRGGGLSIEAHAIRLDHRASIQSTAAAGSSGDAGAVAVTAHAGLALDNGGTIEADTFGAGHAGAVTVSADAISLDHAAQIRTATQRGATGSAGNVQVTAQQGLALATGSQISSSAEGSGDAGSVNVQSGNLLLVDSAIATAAQDGDGGPINIQGGQWLWLKDSQITTSVLGQTNGNGGDITLAGGYLVMQTGFIQANTAAPRATGGNIHLRVDGLIPSGGSLLLGGDEIVESARGQFGRNIIQAAAPNGIGGILDLGGLQLDLNSAISKLHTAPLDVSSLLPDYCRLGVGSSFTRAGRGG